VDFGKNISFSGALILEENWLKHEIPYVIQRNHSILGKKIPLYQGRRKSPLPLFGMVSLDATLTQGLKIRFSASTGQNWLQISDVNPLYIEVICSKFQQRPFPHS